MSADRPHKCTVNTTRHSHRELNWDSMDETRARKNKELPQL